MLADHSLLMPGPNGVWPAFKVQSSSFTGEPFMISNGIRLARTFPLMYLPVAKEIREVPLDSAPALFSRVRRNVV